MIFNTKHLLSGMEPTIGQV